MIAERELGRVKDEIQRLENEITSIREKKNDKEVCVELLPKILCNCSFSLQQINVDFFFFFSVWERHLVS